MENLASKSDEETIVIPLSDVREQLFGHMPPDEQLHLLTHRMEADRYQFQERVESTRRDITNLGLGPAQA